VLPSGLSAAVETGNVEAGSAAGGGNKSVFLSVKTCPWGNVAKRGGKWQELCLVNGSARRNVGNRALC